MKIKNIPNFDVLDKDFEISTIEEENFLLRNIRRKICEQIEHSPKFLEEILQPSSMATMIEVKTLNENDIDESFELFKKLMILTREASGLDFEDSDEQNNNFIEKTLKEWPEYKQKLVEINKKRGSCWSNKTTSKEKAGYLG